MRETKNRKETAKKNQGKTNACKVIAAGILTVGVFGGGFAALNHFVFAAEHNQPVILESAVLDVKAEEALPSGQKAAAYEKADYQIETDDGNPASNPNAISAEEAADIGAEYLWEVYGIDLTEHTISMFYTTDPSRAIGYWHGEVYQTGGSIEDAQYRFGIEAVSGARDSIQRLDGSDADGKTTPFRQKEAEEYYRENCSAYLEKAKIYAESQCLSAPFKAEFVGVSAMIAQGYEYEMPQGTATTMIPEDGQANQDVIRVPWGEEIPAAHVYVSVLVTDADGKQVSLELDTSDQSLASMLNCYAGVEYDPGSVG